MNTLQTINLTSKIFSGIFLLFHFAFSSFSKEYYSHPSSEHVVEGGLIENVHHPIESFPGSIALIHEPSEYNLAGEDYIYSCSSPKIMGLTNEGEWKTIQTTNTPQARHENSFVQVGDKFYLLGGRGRKHVNIYDLKTGSWSNGAQTPIEIHHFQALDYHGLLYIIGAFTGSYPNEKPVPIIYIYNPLTDSWISGPEIPAARRRGSAGAVVYNNKIYLVGGIINGHSSGHVNWVDEYDPKTNTWKILKDAPRARDHFHAAVVGDKIYAASGRRSIAAQNVFANTVPEVDVYDIKTNSWSTLPSSTGNLPTPRAGAGVAVLGEEILIIGGESDKQIPAHNETEALNTKNLSWRKLAPLVQGRHGTQAIVSNNGVYIAAGNSNRGGNAELNTLESFHMHGSTQPSGPALTAGNLHLPNEVKFPDATPGTKGTQTIKLENKQGTQAIIVTKITLSDNNLFKLKTLPQLPVVILPGGNLAVEVEFSSNTAGKKSAILEVLHLNGKSTSSLSAEVKEDFNLSISPGALQFNAQALNTTSGTKDITLTNKGSSNVAINNITLSGSNADDFTHDFKQPQSIQPNHSVKIKVRFAPQSLGVKNAVLTIGYSGDKTAEVQLQGEGIEPPVGKPVVANPIPGQVAFIDKEFSYSFSEDTFTDPDGDALTYSASLSNSSALPAWLNFANSTRTFSGKPSKEDVGIIEIEVTAINSKNASASTTFTITVIEEEEKEKMMVVGLSLINTTDNQEIQLLEDGDVVNLASLPDQALNIRAYIYPEVVGSVKFMIGEENFRIANSFPYDLFDNEGEAGPQFFSEGNYSITAIPFKETNGEGEEGQSLKINFSVIDDEEEIITGTDIDKISSLRVFPNPFNNSIFIQAGKQPIHEVAIYDVSGKLCISKTPDFFNLHNEINIEATSFKPGIYLLKIATQDEVHSIRVIKSH